MYIPVPSVAAGDWIDEIFINTYWKDNFAAGVPDVFSAKGQLAVGLGVDQLGVLNPGADGTILSSSAAEATGLKWVAQPASIITFNPVVSVGGIGTATGTYAIDADVNISGVPSDATAVFLMGTAAWTDVSGNPSILVETNIGNSGFRLYGQVNNKNVNGAGLIPLLSGNFQVRVLTANAGTFTLFCTGYLR